MTLLTPLMQESIAYNRKEQKYDVHGDSVHAQVHDTNDLRAAFLHYCGSIIRPSEMHLAPNGIFMNASQFLEMAQALGLVEPHGTSEA